MVVAGGAPGHDDDGAVVRVLVVDDHPVVRQGLRSFLTSRAGIEVVGEATDGETAETETARLRPDVVLLDLVMPGRGGIASIGRLVQAHRGVRVLVLTSFSSQDQVVPAVRAGAHGYLLKDASPAELEAAVRAVCRGESWLDPQVTRLLMAEVAQPAGRDGGGADRLTPRETEVLAQLGRGLSNRELAATLFVSEKTVKTHVSAILAKLNLTDRTQAALFAVRHGLVRPDDDNP